MSEPATATVKCEFLQLGNEVALVTGAGSVSARGGWDRGDCPSVRAEVSVGLQAKDDGHWRDIVWTTTAIGPPGGHAEAYSRCRNAKRTKWRSIIDVDVVDATDDAKQLVTESHRLRCRPDFPPDK
ncbi:MAG TPA: hypothetical protein VMZ00_07120 [Sporichthya sp.]|nr:hypothetical protein [Sporichthya sp.]